MAEIAGWCIAIAIGAVMLVGMLFVLGVADDTFTKFAAERSVCRKTAATPDEWQRC